MKTAINLFLLILLLTNNSCSKQDDCDNSVDCLPPATQSGANTAGCLINGKVLLPGGQSLNSGSTLFSQYLFYNGQYIFSLSITDKSGEYHRTVKFVHKKDKLEKGKTYSLEDMTSTNSSGMYLVDAGFKDAFETTGEITGGFTISNIDELKEVISGTFWFDAINNEGEIVQIREGRFDVHYQQ